jgi:LPXTG-motif cell wall-anchored protein
LCYSSLDAAPINDLARPQPGEIVTQKYSWSEFETLNAASLSKLALDAPLLRSAYAQAIIAEARPPWTYAVLRDIERRGVETIPLLLSLFNENPDSIFRDELMKLVANFKGFQKIDREPFLKATRELFQQQGLNLPSRTRYAMAEFFEKSGTAADLEIVKKMNYDPITNHELGLELNGTIKRMKMRLANEAAAKTSGTEMRDPEDAKRVWPPSSKQPTGRSSSETDGTAAVATVAGDNGATGNRFMIWVGIAAVIMCGGAWLFLRGRKKV